MPMTVLPADPWTISMHTRRVLPDAPAADARRVHAPAGSIASRNGSATVTPIPLRTVRRERCFLVMCMSSLPEPGPKNPAYCPTGPGLLIFIFVFVFRRVVGGDHRLRLAHLKCRAVDDADDEGGETVISLRCFPDDRAHGRPVVVLDAAADRIRHQVLREIADDRFGQVVHRLTQ